MTNYFAVRSFDGTYLAQEGQGMGDNNFTFDRSEMQLFKDEKTAESYAIQNGWVIDDEESFVVSIDDKMLIEYLEENSIILGQENKNNETPIIDQIKNVVPNPFIPNEWYTGKINNREIEVAINTKGFYQLRMIMNVVLVDHEGNRTNGGKEYSYYRINKKNELIENGHGLINN